MTEPETAPAFEHPVLEKIAALNAYALDDIPSRADASRVLTAIEAITSEVAALVGDLKTSTRLLTQSQAERQQADVLAETFRQLGIKHEQHEQTALAAVSEGVRKLRDAGEARKQRDEALKGRDAAVRERLTWESRANRLARENEELVLSRDVVRVEARDLKEALRATDSAAQLAVKARDAAVAERQRQERRADEFKTAYNEATNQIAIVERTRRDERGQIRKLVGEVMPIADGLGSVDIVAGLVDSWKKASAAANENLIDYTAAMKVFNEDAYTPKGTLFERVHVVLNQRDLTTTRADDLQRKLDAAAVRFLVPAAVDGDRLRRERDEALGKAADADARAVAAEMEVTAFRNAFERAVEALERGLVRPTA